MDEQEIVLDVSKEAFLEWKSHVVTKEIQRFIAKKITEAKEELVTAAYSNDPMTLALTSARLAGNIEGLSYLIDLRPEEQETIDE